MSNEKYRKADVAMEYFPDLIPDSARKKLYRFICENPIWQPGKKWKNRKYFTPIEINQIEQILGKPT